MTQDFFQIAIRAYLDARAKADEQFRVKYSNKNKSIEECANYIYNQVKKSGRIGFADDEIFGMAVHYYDEANIPSDDLKPVNNVRSVINTKIERPMPEPKKAAVKPLTPSVKATPKPTEEKPAQPTQLSLF